MSEPLEIRVERGAPTDEELAALVAVLRLRAGAAPAPQPEHPTEAYSPWRASARPSERGLPRPGAHAWRTAV